MKQLWNKDESWIKDLNLIQTKIYFAVYILLVFRKYFVLPAFLPVNNP